MEFTEYERERIEQFVDASKPTPAEWARRLHPCDEDCIDFAAQFLAGKKGHVCWCECHPWNK